MRLIMATLLAATLSACTTAGSDHPCTGTTQVETRLYLGLSQPGGPNVSASAFARFLKSEVTPRLPEGYTLLEGQGFWREDRSGKTISEPSRVLIHLHDASTEKNRTLDTIAAAYKQAFHQEAVLRTDTKTCVAFR
jgi:hypothetical protein